MKRSVLLVLFLFQALQVQVQAQTLQGTVHDRATGSPVPGVLVYLDGTSTATITDPDGKFFLTTHDFINTSLVFSHVSYNVRVFKNPFTDLPERVDMDGKQYLIDPVVVEPVPFPRDRLLRIFRDNFLGDTRAGRSCRIENEDDILFGFDRSQKILRATSDAPLRIQNSFLGYDILFNLMEFRMDLLSATLTSDGSITRFYGTCTYTDVKDDRRRFLRRRNEAYGNSMNAFFRDLAHRPNEKTDFMIFLNRQQPVEMADLPVIVADSMSVKKITLTTSPESTEFNKNQRADVYLTFDLGNRRHRGAGTSTIYFTSGRFMVDRYGNIDNVLGVTTIGGTMARERLGTMLPLDFEDRLHNRP